MVNSGGLWSSEPPHRSLGQRVDVSPLEVTKEVRMEKEEQQSDNQLF